MRLFNVDRPSIFPLILASAMGAIVLFIPPFGFLFAPAICVILFAYVSNDSKKRLLITMVAPILGFASVLILWGWIIPGTGDISLLISLCLFPVPYVVYVWRSLRKRDSTILLTVALCLFAVVFVAWWQANNVLRCNIISIAEKGITAKEVNYCQNLGLYVPGRSDAFLGWPESARNILILPTMFAVTIFAFLVLLDALKTVEVKKSGKAKILAGLTLFCVIAGAAIVAKSVLPFVTRVSSENSFERPMSQILPIESIGEKPSKIGSNEYEFSCLPASSMSQEMRTNVNALIRQEGWREISGFDGHVCMQGDSSTSAIIWTDNCTNDRCEKAGLLLLAPHDKTLKVIATEETNEMMGAASISNVLRWTSDSVTYRHSGFVSDGGCVESEVKGVVAYQDVEVSLTTGVKRIMQTCTYESCDTSKVRCSQVP